MTDPRACKVCPFLHPEDSLSMKDVLEWERIDLYLREHRRLPRASARTYVRLFALRYWPPCDLERMGAA